MIEFLPQLLQNENSFGSLLVALSIGTIFYIYFGYPVLLLVVGAFFRRRRPEPSAEFTPSISVLIAAHNEEDNIGRKVRETLELDYPADKIEVLVLSDCSSDRTDRIVKAIASEDPRVRLLRMNQRRGKTHAQNMGVRKAKGEIIVFSDATTVYGKQALRYLVSNYKDPKVGAATGRNQYFDPDGDSPTGLGTMAFWNYENVIKMMQSRISTLSGCCGCIYSIRKRLYTELADDVISDLVQPLWVIKKKHRVVFEHRALAYEETTRTAKEEFSMRVRVVTRAMRGVATVADLLLPWRHGWVSLQLLSHKVLRWMIPLFLVAAFVGSLLAFHTDWVRCALMLQIALYLTALLETFLPLHRLWKGLGVPLYFCTINAAALVGIFEALRGRKYVVWQTVRAKTAIQSGLSDLTATAQER